MAIRWKGASNLQHDLNITIEVSLSIKVKEKYAVTDVVGCVESYSLVRFPSERLPSLTMHLLHVEM